MSDIVSSGKALYWGTSEWAADEIRAAWEIAERHHLHKPVVEQPQYNLLHRGKVEIEYARLYEEIGLGTTIWSPLASGVLSGKHSLEGDASSRLRAAGLDWLRERELTEARLKKVDETKVLAAGLGLSLPVFAIAWCLKNPRVSTVILGASKTAQLVENLKAVEAQDLELPVDQHAVLPVSYTHLRAHETVLDLVCRLLLDKKNQRQSLGGMNR